MDQPVVPEKIKQAVKKYRYPLLVLLIGVILMLIPTGKKQQTQQVPAPEPTVPVTDLQEELQNILAQVQGAGKVRVLLSVSKGETTVYQTDSDVSGGENGVCRVDTVIITGTDRGQSGLIQHIDPPLYLGALVVCQGADSPSVRLAITNAVSSITGLGADKITVLKMK